MTTPDAQTLARLTALASVGNAIQERFNDNTQGTDYLLALQDLANFEAGVKDLDIPPQIATGMHNLISYLRTKINKRINSANSVPINL